MKQSASTSSNKDKAGATEFIFRVRIDNFSKEEIEGWINNALENPPRQKFAVTLNPEILLKARRNRMYQEVLNSADLNLCDGFGIQLVFWPKGKKIKTRYTGVDLVAHVLKKAKAKGIAVLVATARNSLSSLLEIEKGIEDNFGLRARVKYWDDEYFFESDEAKSAEIVFVNFGAPEQEKFIFENREKFPKAKILAGVGGAFDFFSGKIKRAPKWMRKAGLEWLWRLAREPKRTKRIISAVIVFPWVILISRRK